MKIYIPTPLRAFTGKQETVVVSAPTLEQALAALTVAHPEIKAHLFTPEGKVRSFVNLYLNDEDVRYLPQKEQTAVTERDSLTIIPSIAGGALPAGQTRAKAKADSSTSLRNDKMAARKDKVLVVGKIGVER